MVEDQTHEDGGGTARVTASPNRRDNATLAVQRLSHHFIEMPTTEGFRSGFTQVLGNKGPEFVNPQTDRLIADRQSALSQEILDIPVAQGEPKIETHSMSDDVGGNQWRA